MKKNKHLVERKGCNKYLAEKDTYCGFYLTKNGIPLGIQLCKECGVLTGENKNG